MIKKIKSFAAGLSVSFFAATSLFSAECIAPANPGGGWDFTCKLLQKLCMILVLMIHLFR